MRVTGTMQMWVTPADQLAEHHIAGPYGGSGFRAQVRQLDGGMEWQWHADEIGAVKWCLDRIRHITKQPYCDILPAGAVSPEIMADLKQMPEWTREVKPS